MRDPRDSQSDPVVRGGSARPSREALQQALQALRGGADGAPLSSEALTDLARRAGVTDSAQIAELGRMIGAQPVGTPGGAPRQPQHVLFLLADGECALPAGAVQGVERLGEVAAVPNTAPWVLGVVQVWGTIISVVDLRRFFDLPPEPPTPRNRVLVVSQREMTIGFVVDAVTEMRSLVGATNVGVDRGSVPGWALPYAQAALQVERRVVALLDPERLLFGDKVQHYRADVP